MMTASKDKQPISTDEATECDDETACGFSVFHISWLQRLADMKAYVIVYGLIGFTQFAIAAYFVATISTLEKRFKIPSRTSGLISSSWEFGVVVFVLFLSYLGGRSHKTRWVASGTLCVGLSCFLWIIPHWMYGPGEEALALTEEFGPDYAELSINDTENDQQLCAGEHQDDEDCSGNYSLTSTAIFIIARILMGIGTSVYYTLGVSYMDDNAKKDETPILLAVTYCIRMIGPTVGFLYGSYCLKKFIDPNLHPLIDNSDPRWIGAWWCGWAVLGVVMIILSLAFSLFPRTLPRTAKQRLLDGYEIRSDEKLSMKDFKVTMNRLFNNKILIYNSLSTVCFCFGVIGYWYFMPKYMETQFRQSASSANLITGTVGLICSALGVLSSGIVITKFKPRARLLAGWNVFTEFFDVFGHLMYAFLGCPADDMHGRFLPDGGFDLNTECNTDCGCAPTTKYTPICSEDGTITFYSPCHAGCHFLGIINGSKSYTNCTCIPSSANGASWANSTLTGTLMGGTAVEGPCPVDCSTGFTAFLVLMCILRFWGSSGRAGNLIIHFRCVKPEDKAVSLGFIELIMAALAFIPGPIVYGALLDLSCLVWGVTCGSTGNCWLYDGQTVRYYLNFTSTTFLLIGACLDIGVWRHVKGLQIYDEEKKNKTRDTVHGGTSLLECKDLLTAHSEDTMNDKIPI